MYFNSSVYRANTTRKVDASSFTGFDSYFKPLIVDDMDWVIDSRVRELSVVCRKTVFYEFLSDEFFVVNFCLGSPFQFFRDCFYDQSFRAFLVVVDYGLVDLVFEDQSFLEILKDVAKTKIVFMVLQKNQTYKINDKLFQDLKNSNIIINTEITQTAAITKLSFLLGNYKDQKKIIKKLKKSIAGEQSSLLYKKISKKCRNNFLLDFFNSIRINIKSENVILSKLEYQILDLELKSIIKYFFELGITYNSEDTDSNTSLHYIVEIKKKDLIIFLLNLGVDFSKKDSQGRNCTFRALLNFNKEVFDVLNSKFGPIAPFKLIFNILKKFVKKNDFEKFEFLVQNGLDSVNKYLDFDKSNLGLYVF